MNRVYDSHLSGVTLHDLTGERLPLESFVGHPLLVVNVASECGLTPQYEGLQVLHEHFSGGPNGLIILACPCNQFGGQEPGDAEQIQRFIQERFGVEFLVSEKIDVNGPDRHPLYQNLIGDGPDIEWNFAKFLVGGDGEILMRAAPTTAPDSPELLEIIESLLEEEEEASSG